MLKVVYFHSLWVKIRVTISYVTTDVCFPNEWPREILGATVAQSLKLTCILEEQFVRSVDPWPTWPKST